MSNFNSVKKFMQTFGQEVKKMPNFQMKKLLNLGLSL